MIDLNASNFINAAISVGEIKVEVDSDASMENLKNSYIPWENKDGNRMKISDITDNKIISDHEWEQKTSRIDQFKKQIQNFPDWTSTVFQVSDIDEDSPRLIIDGVKRSIAFVYAKKEDANLNARLTIVRLKSPNMHKMYDYQLVIQNLLRPTNS